MIITEKPNRLHPLNLLPVFLPWNGPLVTLLGLALALAAGLLLVRLTPLDGALFVGLAVAGVATVIEPLVGLAAALFLGPLWAYLRAEAPQAPAQIAQVFVALTLAAWLARGLARRNLRITCSPVLLSLAAFLGAALLSLWNAVELPVFGVPELVKWVQILLVFLFVSDYLGMDMETSPLTPALSPRGRGRTLPLTPALSPGGRGRTLPLTPALSPRGRGRTLPLTPALSPGGRGRTLPLTPALSPGGRGGTGICPARCMTWLLGVLLVTGLFQAGVGVWQFGLRGEGPEHFAILGGRFYRAYGTFEQPNPYAGFLGLMLPLALGLLWGIITDKGTRRQEDKETRGNGLLVSPSPPLLVSPSPCLPLSLSPLLLVIFAMGAALVMSWSRGAWLGFGAAMAVMAIALPRQARWGLLLVVALVVGALGLYSAGLLPASVVARLTDFARDVRFEDVRGVGINDANYAVIERLAHWQAALEMFRYNFWTGVGFGCYEPAYRTFALINWPIALGHAHNYYLNLAAETGIIGLVAYVLLWGVVFWQTWRATRRAEGLWRGIAIGLLGTWTHLTVHHLLDNLYVNNVHLHVGVLLGLLACVNGQIANSK